MSPTNEEILADLRLEPEKRPQLVRSGGTGAAPIEWEKLIGPAIKGLQGQDVLIQVFPKEGLPQSDEEKIAARRQAASRAGAISNRYYHHVPDEHVETSVRQREEGNFGVYAVHHGPMTDEAREKLTNRRQSRNRKGSTQDAELPDDETEVSTPPPAAPAAPAASIPAAERVRQAAKKQQG